jgi:hypothetical protein
MELPPAGQIGPIDLALELGTLPMHNSEADRPDSHRAAGTLLNLLLQQEGAEWDGRISLQAVFTQIKLAGPRKQGAGGPAQQPFESLQKGGGHSSGSALFQHGF